MPQVKLNLGAEELKAVLLQLPPRELVKLVDALEERVETLAMMHLAETGLQEWGEEGEGIYDDAKA